MCIIPFVNLPQHQIQIVLAVCLAIASAMPHHNHHNDGHNDDTPAHYEFSYAVNDPHTADIKSQQESRHGDNVQGRYELIDSDGYKRIVEYTADAEHGFNAVVHRVPTDIRVPVPAPQPHHQHQQHNSGYAHQPLAVQYHQYQPQQQVHQVQHVQPLNYHAHPYGGSHNMHYMHGGSSGVSSGAVHQYQPLTTVVHHHQAPTNVGGHQYGAESAHVRFNAPGITSYQY